MPETPEEIILPEAATERTLAGEARRFPALLQLGLLACLLVLLFAGLVGPYIWKNQIPVVPTTAILPVPANTPSLAIIPTISALPLQARAVYVYDVATSRALYEKNPDRVLPLASITKLMTTLVAHNLIADDTNIRIPEAAMQVQSGSGLTAGEVMTHEALQSYAMMASSNDAAYSLAAAAGALLTDSTNNLGTFVAAMNITADDLGLSSLKFYNATGLDLSPTEAGAYGSARDVTFLLEHILKNAPNLLLTTTESNNRIYNTTGAYHEAENTNPTIKKIPNLLGSKTGYTKLAGGNLTIVYDAGFNRPIIITVLGSSLDDRFTDVLQLVAAVQRSLGTVDETSNQ